MQKVHDGLRFLSRFLPASLALPTACRAAAKTLHMLQHFGYPARRRLFPPRSRAAQGLPDADDLLFNIARVTPGEHRVHRGTLEILMLPAKRIDGCVPGEDVSSKAFQIFVHAVAPRFLSKARSRFWRSVSRAVSFSWSCTHAKVCVSNWRWTRVSRLVML